MQQSKMESYAMRLSPQKLSRWCVLAIVYVYVSARASGCQYMLERCQLITSMSFVRNMP